MRKTVALTTFCLLFSISGGLSTARSAESNVVHDAEFYILEAQNGATWTAEDKALDARLAELRKNHGTPPNIVHIMWDDTAYGDVGIPAIQMVRGLKTPNLNTMAEQGRGVLLVVRKQEGLGFVASTPSIQITDSIEPPAS